MAVPPKDPRHMDLLTMIPDLEGLLVTRTTGKDNEYRRIGYFKSLSGGKDMSAFLGHERSEILLV
jgi:hypothetical protein